MQPCACVCVCACDVCDEPHGARAPLGEHEGEVREEVALQLVAVESALVQAAVRADELHQIQHVLEAHGGVGEDDGSDAKLAEQRRPHQRLAQKFEVVLGGQSQTATVRIHKANISEKEK